MKKGLLSLSVATLLFSNLQANNLEEKFTTLLQEHNLIKQSKQNVQSANAKVDLEKTGWYPELSVTLEAGRDNYDRSNSDSTHQNTHGATVNLNQLVWDFGALNSSIDKSKLGVTKAEAELERQKQYLILSGLEAMIDLYSATKKYEYAKDSEENIMNQTKLESARIEAGNGYTTDLLQAKSQLASAEAKRVEAEAILEKAQNRYKAVFKNTNYNVEQISLGNLESLLPKTLEEAIDKALKVNPDLVVSQSDNKIAISEIDRVSKSEWAPKINLVGKYANDYNPDGATFRREQTNIGLQATWKLNLGGKASKATAVAQHNANSTKEQLSNTEFTVVEKTSNAWSSLQSAMKRSDYLGNQASILGQFLELARKERELGKRSLLDVLTAETSLLNAKSDKMMADSEVLKSKLNLLLQVSNLNLSIVK